MSDDAEQAVQFTAANYIDPETEAHYTYFESFHTLSTVLHYHDYFELFLVVEGRTHHEVNGERQLLEAGALLLIRPADAHRFYHDRENACRSINLAFAQSTMRALFDYLGAGFPASLLLEAKQPPLVQLSPAEREQVQARLQQLNAVAPDERARTRTLLRILLLELITGYFFDLQPQGEPLPDWLRQLLDGMQSLENLVGGVPRMQELAPVTAEHLSRSFKRYLEMTPTDYVNRQRLTIAANLLTHSDRTVLDISLLIGFENLSHFYHLFKEQYATTPAEFRSRRQKLLMH